jgi:hypothetical protein
MKWENYKWCREFVKDYTIGHAQEFHSKLLTTVDMELALTTMPNRRTRAYIDIRRELVVPNVHWGAGLHECDLFVLSKAGYATEIEIKISRADLVQDAKKKHGHVNYKIKQLYFAIPEHLVPYIKYIPERAGILIVYYASSMAGPYVKCIRTAKITGNFKYNLENRMQITRLGALRIWNLKSKVRKLQGQLNAITKKDGNKT